jgi:predicted GNAT family acetyltransferase
MRDNVEASRFELEENGLLVVANYRRGEGVLSILHVEAAPPLRGTGAAGRLMRAIAEQAGRDQIRIRPLCGYAAAWLRRSPEFRKLVA